MSVYKPILTSDVVVSSFEVNKYFSFTGEEIAYGSAYYGTNLYGEDANESINDVFIDRFLAYDTPTSSYFDLTTEPTTGYFKKYYQKLVFNTIKQLYYSNFTTSSWGDSLTTASLLPGANIEGNVLAGPASSQGRFYNYPQTNLTESRVFPQGDHPTLGVLSIPSKLYGNYIQPTTFHLKFKPIPGTSLLETSSNHSYYNITDDGEGNLLLNGSYCGNIIYNQGLAILTGLEINGYGQDVYGLSTYGDTEVGFVNYAPWLHNFVATNNITCSFSSSFDIIETQYKCTINANEFNYSLNPSLLEDSIKGQNKLLCSGESTYVYYVTGSDFTPYVTTVGLYNEDQELLAIGKLSQPLPTSKTTDTTIVINLDR